MSIILSCPGNNICWIFENSYSSPDCSSEVDSIADIVNDSFKDASWVSLDVTDIMSSGEKEFNYLDHILKGNPNLYYIFVDESNYVLYAFIRDLTPMNNFDYLQSPINIKCKVKIGYAQTSIGKLFRYAYCEDYKFGDPVPHMNITPEYAADFYKSELEDSYIITRFSDVDFVRYYHLTRYNFTHFLKSNESFYEIIPFDFYGLKTYADLENYNFSIYYFFLYDNTSGIRIRFYTHEPVDYFVNRSDMDILVKGVGFSYPDEDFSGFLAGDVLGRQNLMDLDVIGDGICGKIESELGTGDCY